VGVERRVGDDDDIVLVLPPLAGLRVLRAGELECDEDAVVALAVVAAGAVEELPADALDRERPDVPEDDGGGIELVTAEFGHQPAAGLVEAPPADQLGDVLEPVLLGLAERQLGELLRRELLGVLARDLLPPRIDVVWDAVLLVVLL